MRAPLLALFLLASCAKRDPDPAPTPPPPPAPSDAAVAVAVDAAPPDASGNQITIRAIEPRDPAQKAAAARCSLDGDPLNGDYMKGPLTLATSGPALYVSDGVTVRRYLRGPGDTCALVLDAKFGTAGVLTPPPREANPQVVGKGPVYLSSGADWKIAAGAGGAIYYVDFTRGIYRVDHGKAEPICPGLSGVGSLAVVGGKTFTDRDSGTVALGGKCPTKARVLSERVQEVFAVGDALYAALDLEHVARFGKDNAIAARFGSEDTFKPGGLCAVAGVAACGDAICILDHNCPRIERFAPDGTFRDQLDDRALFEQRVYGISAMAAGPNGLWLAAVHKDGEVSEGAIYWLPLAAFAPAAPP
ncbi:MAG: hypothetical protein K8W52_13250 [Deltaproteobacteria bacterium]|nr:hypothetical protein [Deltaproteobacteria bacterium]